ncbi:NAD(P)-dependent oxidoreductase [Kribbella sp. NPDC055071]
MRIIVFGATGTTGREVVRQALEAGHQVTAFVRDAARLDLRHPRLEVITGEVTDDQAAVTAAVKGQDAVVSALGTEQTVRGTRSPGLMARAIPVIVEAMTSTGVDRLVFLSAFGVGDSLREAPLLLRIMYRLFLGRVFADKAEGERLLRDSALDWTLIYPILLTNGPQTGVYRPDTHLTPRRPWRISRADVAEFMLDQLHDRTYSHSVAIITSGR